MDSYLPGILNRKTEYKNSFLYINITKGTQNIQFSRKSCLTAAKKSEQIQTKILLIMQIHSIKSNFENADPLNNSLFRNSK